MSITDVLLLLAFSDSYALVLFVFFPWMETVPGANIASVLNPHSYKYLGCMLSATEGTHGLSQTSAGCKILSQTSFTRGSDARTVIHF